MTYNELKIWFRIWYKKENRFYIPMNEVEYILTGLKDIVTMYFTWIDESLKRFKQPTDVCRWYKSKLIQLRKDLIASGYKG